MQGDAGSVESWRIPLAWRLRRTTPSTILHLFYIFNFLNHILILRAVLEFENNYVVSMHEEFVDSRAFKK